MKFFGYLFAAVLILLGVIFLAAAGKANTAPRLIIGGLITAGGIGLIVALRMRVPEQKVRITRHIELSGDVKLEKMRCTNCSAPLDEKSVTLREGAVWVKCGYCGSSYEIEEAPKW